MFKEIAVEPAAVASSYRDFAYIIEKFGIPEGRLIAAFPRRWKRFVYSAAQERLRGMAELSRLEVRLRDLKDDAFYWRGRPGDGCDQDWLGSAIAEHAREPFDAIISAALTDAEIVVLASDLDGQHPCLQPNRQWHIDREAVQMALCCAPLLVTAKNVKLVDPHFDLGQARFRRPFAEFLKSIHPGTVVEIFRGDGQSEEHLTRRLAEALNGLKPEGVKVHLHLLPQDTMHNRYVLTAAGGLYFLTGLDDKGDGDLVTDEVGVLEDAVWRVQWDRYSGAKPIAVWP